jgi:hypothetical protein
MIMMLVWVMEREREQQQNTLFHDYGLQPWHVAVYEEEEKSWFPTSIIAVAISIKLIENIPKFLTPWIKQISSVQGLRNVKKN